MAPGVAASKTKKEFFTHLGLQEGSEEDERLFRKMLVRHLVRLSLELHRLTFLARTKLRLVDNA